MGERWSLTEHYVIIDEKRNAYTASGAVDALNAYEARIAELEAMLASEAQDNTKLRAREVGDEVGNVLQELAEANNRIAELEAEAKANIEWQEAMVLDIAAARAELARVKAEQGRLRQIILDDAMELARVKAESLRVVELPPCKLMHYDGSHFKLDGKILTIYARTGTWVSVYESNDPIYFDVDILPVRIEHWETTE